MKKKKISFVFFGSGPVAASSLALLAKSFDVEAVVTKPTTFREMQSVLPNTTTYTVSDSAELDDLFTTNNFQSRVGILIDFGIIVSNKIISAFEKGIINSHFSLLPELRGADPISFSILEGKQKTGVSLMLLVKAMDEGPLLHRSEIPLDGSETTPSLTDTLVVRSADDIKEVLPSWMQGEITEQQQAGTPTYTRKLTKKNGNIDWTKPADQIEKEIRAYQGWPKSTTSFGNINCIITRSSAVDGSGKAGDLFIHEKKLTIYCGENALIIELLKPAGKQEMGSEAFLAGYLSRLNIK